MLGLLLELTAPAAFAQSSSVSSGSATAAQSAEPVTAEDLQNLVNTIQDPAARAKLVKELQGLIAAQRGVQQKSPAHAVRNFFATLSDGAHAVGGEILAAATVVVDAPRVVAWLRDQAGNAEVRQRWEEVSTRLAILFGLAVVADWLVWFLLRGATAAFAARSGETTGGRIAYLLLNAIFEALPIAAFAATAFVVLPLTAPHFVTERVAITVISAYLWSRAIAAAARIVLLSPNALALYRLGEETRNYLYIWIRRFANFWLYGFAIAGCGWWLGVPGAIYAILLRVVILILGLLAIIFVLQNRMTVAQCLRGPAVVPSGRGHGWRLLRQRLADAWHILAVIVIIGAFGISALHIQGGFVFLVRATLLSVVVVLAAVLAAQFVDRTSERGFAINPELKSRFPTLEARTNRYIPAVMTLTSVAIYVIAALAVLQAWGIDSFLWLQATAASPAFASIASIAIVLAAAVAAWEAFVLAVEHHMLRYEDDSRRRARARTMVPFLHIIALVILSVIVVFAVLGALGINIGALLAGAGVFGIIAGLGSQSIIKDFMTSIAVLVDDTFAVGDVVNLGNDHTGMVEAMSIRTIKLRAFDGSLHTVPFSEAKVIQNLTKDYSYYLANVGVAYHEDTDRVVKVLVQVVEEMRKEKTFSHWILEPLDVVGVDRFADSAVIILVRIKTLPIRQWVVGREFNRRMKQAFDREGIEIPFPARTIYFGAGGDDAAAPSRAGAKVDRKSS
ncbi:MAG: mechanosensitive ion channel family protein [Alphaproteobacteria bacterium]|nr:mechanosensitive ion channel family protein [Alphaproteobacteria bacterium]